MENNQPPQRIVYGIILSVMLLAILGIVSLYSTTVLIQDGSIVTTLMQVAWYGVGIVAAGVIMMIVFHVLENIGMNIGLLAVTGIPLPFVYQGGSALLGNMMGVSLIMSMRFHHKSYLYSRTERKTWFKNNFKE